MKIVHYSLGLPPYRSGGLVKYCMDLMGAQIKARNEVILLWPGRINEFSQEINLKGHKPYIDSKGNLIYHYELINPLPVPLLNGIKDFDEYTKIKKKTAINEFIEKEKPDVVHFHTLMGFPKEWVDTLKQRGIKTVFTTHDYFGICSKCTLFKEGQICLDDRECRECISCNKTALSLNKVKFLQSSLYSKLKDSLIIKTLREKYKAEKEVSDMENINLLNIYSNIEIENLSRSYRKLRDYYLEILTNIDIYHFNSTNTQKTYSQYMNLNNKSRIINITHNNINDNRTIQKVEGKIRFGYLGPINTQKGFYLLREVCDRLAEKYDFELHIYSQFSNNRVYIKQHNPYKYSELNQVMKSFDVLITPSLSNETFGFTVLEALSRGVPSVITETVGAKDLIINQENGIIFKPSNNELYGVLEELIKIPHTVEKMSKKINEMKKIETMEEHEKKIKKLYLES